MQTVAWMTVIVTMTLLITTDACKEKLRGWRMLGFSERFRNEAINSIIKGTVTRIYPRQHIAQLGGDVYTAHVRLECVYKGGDGLRQSSYVNVTGFGETNDCVNTQVYVGGNFIMFVKSFSYNQYIRYAVHEFNEQRGVEQASPPRIATITSVYACRGVTNTTTTVAPWKSLTPIKEVPWLILPKEKRKKDGPENGGNTPCSPCFVIVMTALLNVLYCLR